jgi:hypothetical protein
MSDDKAKPKKKEIEWEDVESANFVRFEEFGDSVEGKLIDKGKSEQFGFGLFTVQNKDDEALRFHGSAQLDDLMLGVGLGTYIYVEFVDVQKTPRGEMKLFKLRRAKTGA